MFKKHKLNVVIRVIVCDTFTQEKNENIYSDTTISHTYL